MYESELAHHIAQQDAVDEFAFCVGCGEIVYLHDRDTYATCQNGVICSDCTGEHFTTDAAANDADVMAFEEYQEHWCIFYGMPVPR